MDKLASLLRIGLTEGEAKVYMALIELGSSTVGPIVKKAKVAYSNVYEILQRLMEKGIVSYIIKNKTKYFQAAPLSNLQEYLENKEKELNKEKSILQGLLPELETLRKIKPEQEAEVFIGKKGLRTAYEKFNANWDKKETYRFFYIHKKEYAKESDLFYFSLRHLLKGKEIKGITNEGEGRKSEFTKKIKDIEYRYVDFPIPANIDIARDNLLMISWEKPVVAILIQSRSMAETYRKYFDSVWKAGRK